MESFSVNRTPTHRVSSRCATTQVGHHKGDVQENVISNIMKGCSILQLAGMYPQVPPSENSHLGFGPLNVVLCDPPPHSSRCRRWEPTL